MPNKLNIVRIDNEQLSHKTKLALVEIIRCNSDDGEPFKLPSEDQLSQMIGVSRNVLRDALMSLEEMGYVTRRRSKGTFANPRVANENCRLDTKPELCDMIEAQGYAPRCEMQKIGFVYENDPIFNKKITSYLNVEKLFFADDQPIAYCIDHINGKYPEQAGDSIFRLKELSYLEFLKRYCKTTVAYTMATMDAVMSEPWHDQIFCLDKSEIILTIEDCAYSDDLDVVVHSYIYFRKGFLPLKFMRKSW